MKYAGFLKPEEKEIRKNPIPNHPNIVKIIIATNAIESSITIDGLAAVIDCGIFNQPILDKEKGILKLEENPISIQSQTQRRGRVGRKMEGICVQLTIKNHPPVELVSPEIEKEDISLSVLSLRRIGIKLEKIKNLPEPGVKPIEMTNYLNELRSYGAIDSNGNLTGKGWQLNYFSPLLPFVATSIFEVSQKYRNQENISKIVGSLVFLILITKDLIVDKLSKELRRNFNPDSDIITILKTIIEVMKENGSSKAIFSKYGFHPANALRMIGDFEKIVSNIYGNKDKPSWNDIDHFCRHIKMMEFIQMILNQIETHKRKWTSCRRAQYHTVSNMLNEYSFIYKGDTSLIEENDAYQEIIMKMRPGATGLASPGQCYIFQISKSENDIFFGSMIHRNISIEETCHPLIIKTPINMNNQFTMPLIEAYLGENSSLFRPFQKTKTYQETKHGGLICSIEQFDNNFSILSYAPENANDPTSLRLMNLAYTQVKKIIEFAPRTILIRNDALKALVAVTGVGSQNFTTKVFNYTDPNPIPYQVDKITIDYLISHINEMKSVDSNLAIAMTGEKFFYSSEDEDFLGLPITWPSAQCVFGLTPLFYSHLVIISDKTIPKAQRLTWVDQRISTTYSDVDALVHIANTMYRGTVSVSHSFDHLYGMTKNAQCNVEGNFPELRGATQDSNVHRPIGCMLDRYAMYCVKNDSLIHNIKLKNFTLTGNINCNKLRSDIIASKRIRKMFPNNFDKLLDYIQHNIGPIQGNINRLVARRKEISEAFPRLANNKSIRLNMINEQSQIKSSLEQLNNLLYRKRIELGLQDMNDKDFNQLIRINTPAYILSFNLFVLPNYIQTLVKVDDEENTIRKIRQYNNDLDFESIPKCDVVIHHRKNSKLNKQEFIEKVRQVSQRFGRVVKFNFDDIYTDSNHNSKFDRGFIKATLLGGEFVIPFVGEIKRAIGFGAKVPLKIPHSIIPFCVRFRPNVIRAINDWIDRYGLQLQQAGTMFIGSEQEVQKAKEYLSSSRTKLEIPYKSFIIPGRISIAHVISMVNKGNRRLSYNQRWAVDKQTNQASSLVVPNDIDEKVVASFFKKIQRNTGHKIEKDDEVIYNYLLCCDEEDISLSGSQIPLYNEDGSFVCHSFCINCAHDMILYAIGNLYDQEEAQPRMDLVIGNVEKIKAIPPLPTTGKELWPSIPFGQLLWSLISEPKLNAPARTWFSAIVYQALHSSFEFCPDHPKILLRQKKNGILRCAHHECQMFLCKNCKKWHKSGECNGIPEVPMGYRICPSCKRPVEKTQDCNHIHCTCGKHFCYYCGWGPQDDQKLVYQHMNKEHGGCFNDPPDYKRLRNENVSDEEIEAFYNKYPKLRPINYSSNRSRRIVRFLKWPF